MVFFRQRPYHAEYIGSRPITEIKQRRARLVLRWGTAWEHRVLLASSNFFWNIFAYMFPIFAFLSQHTRERWHYFLEIKQKQTINYSNATFLKSTFRNICVAFANSGKLLINVTSMLCVGIRPKSMNKKSLKQRLIANDHTTLNTSVLVRSPKLSSVGRG